MLCPECLKKGDKEKMTFDADKQLRCGKCYGIFDQPVLEKEDLELMKLAANYDDIYRLPFGYAIDRAGKSQAKLGMMMYRIYERWQNNPDIDPDIVISTTIKFILEFSKENAKKELKKIAKQLIDNEKADLQILFMEVNLLMDKIITMITTINKINDVTNT